ncbi:MAG TPA: DUF3891 family protein [Solirubrobacteraceae bacterium]|jgi:hypothetical protein|nr:DUF3891 family protein [Solirubrobacteraceae bacterium]
MLLRRDDRGVLAIGQPSHAWVSGQVARAWGNERFGAVEPREELCLAAEQHDIGMADWDLEPSFNARTGLPHAFTEMPLDVHLELWRGAPLRLIRQSRYAAVLCSLHGMRLYQMRDLAQLAARDADEVRAMIAFQQTLQAELCASLGLDVADAGLRRASDLVWTWDYLSLALCLGWPPCTAKAVPTSSSSIDLVLSPGGAHLVHIDPWPFAATTVTVHCEGQRLAGPYASENELRAALAASPWETLPIELTPARNA